MNDSENKGLFKSLFAKRSGNGVKKEDADDYTVKKDKTIDIITRILSVLGAIFIWIYVVTTDVAAYEFKNMRVALRGENVVQHQGYSVEYEPVYISFKVQGGASKISNLTGDSAKAYIDLAKVDLTGIVGTKYLSVPIVLEYPRGLSCVEQSQDTVYVTIFVSSEAVE